MKKYIAIFLVLVLMLSLTACGEDTPKGTTPGAQASDPISGNDPGGETQAPEVKDTPFGQYHSEEELLAMLESGDFSAYLSVDPEGPAESVDSGGDEPYTGFSNAITFTDGGTASGVEYPDLMSQLSPEMQAEWEEMEQALTDPEMMEMFEGMEGEG